jgi:hypothetical protein
MLRLHRRSMHAGRLPSRQTSWLAICSTCGTRKRFCRSSRPQIWSPPLAIPYALMAAGMTLLCLQIAVQIVNSFGRIKRA